jgi:hypothetical protein
LDLKPVAVMTTSVLNKPSANETKGPIKVAQDGITQNKQRQNEAIEYGYNQVAKSMESSNIRGNAIKSMDDGRLNYSKIGMLNLNTIPANGPRSVSVELSAIRRDTITMMNKLPIEVNIKVADEIRHLIELNEFPTDAKKINEIIQEISQSLAKF